MREQVNLFNREYRDDRTENFEESVNAFKTVEVNSVLVGRLTQGEPTVDQENERILVKDNGVLKELAIVNGEIKLKEI